MLQPKISAIKNILGKDTKLTLNAETIYFKKDEVKIVSPETAAHAITRHVGIELKHEREDEPGKFDKKLHIRIAFKQVPVEEAIKAGVKFDENPNVAAEGKRQAAELAAREKERADWEKGFKEKFMAELKEQGLAIVPVAKK